MPVTIEITVGAITSRFTCDGDVRTLFGLFLESPYADPDGALASFLAAERARGNGTVEGPRATPAVASADPHDLAGNVARVREHREAVAAAPVRTAPPDPPPVPTMPTGARPRTRQGMRDYDDQAIAAAIAELAARLGHQRVALQDVWARLEPLGLSRFSVRAAVDRLIPAGVVVRVNQRILRLALGPERMAVEAGARRTLEAAAPLTVSSAPAPPTMPTGVAAAPVVGLAPKADVTSEQSVDVDGADPQPAAAGVVPSPVVRTIQERRADIRRALRDVLNDEERCALSALVTEATSEVEDATAADVEYVLNTLRNENQIGVMTIGRERVYSRRPTVTEVV